MKLIKTLLMKKTWNYYTL